MTRAAFMPKPTTSKVIFVNTVEARLRNQMRRWRFTALVLMLAIVLLLITR